MITFAVAHPLVVSKRHRVLVYVLDVTMLVEQLCVSVVLVPSVCIGTAYLAFDLHLKEGIGLEL